LSEFPEEMQSVEKASHTFLTTQPLIVVLAQLMKSSMYKHTRIFCSESDSPQEVKKAFLPRTSANRLTNTDPKSNFSSM